MSEVLLMNARIKKLEPWVAESAGVAMLNRIASRFSSPAPLEEALQYIVEVIPSAVRSDACFIYFLEGDDLFLRASKNPHPELVNRLTLRLGQGMTGWLAEHREPVAVSRRAFEDPRFKLFSDLPEHRFESFLSVPMVSGGRLLGVINLQNRTPYQYSPREISLTATVGFMIGAEVERARLESENVKLSARLETRKIVERAKGVLQREMNLSEDEAYRTMQRESQERRKSMKEIAEAVLLMDTLKRRAS